VENSQKDRAEGEMVEKHEAECYGCASRCVLTASRVMHMCSYQQSTMQIGVSLVNCFILLY